MFNRKPRAKSKALNQPIPPGWKIVDLGMLGHGGMSQVYRVRDQLLDRETALKVLRPELVKEPDAFERFVEEAKITAQLDHPNIPPVYALACEKKKTTCFSMKVLEGITLQKMLERGHDQGVEALMPALEVLSRACDAVAFAHGRGIIHCDLKPQNIMVADHGQIYVVDWGLARRKQSLPTKESDHDGALGTPAYMAPEQARGQNYAIDERTDVFALGGILYRILVGKPPYVASTATGTRVLAEQGTVKSPELAAPAGSHTPRRLVMICNRALAADPAARYQSVAELKSDLDQFIKGVARLPELVFQAGEAIVREGEVGNCAYIIIEGHCQANRLVGGKAQMLRLLGAGEMFGETAVLTGNPRLATVSALVKTTVAVVDRSFLEEEMERSSLIAMAVRTVAGSFLDLNAQTASLMMAQTHLTAVELVLRELALSGQPGARESRWVSWKALLSQVAEKTGLAPAAVTERVSKQPGLRIDLTNDRLVLSRV